MKQLSIVMAIISSKIGDKQFNFPFAQMLHFLSLVIPSLITFDITKGVQSKYNTYQGVI